MRGKAIVAMSGGVDSSVAALLMQQEGYDCIGVTMKLFHNDDIGVPKDHTCCSLDDTEDARSVARELGIPHYVFNFSDGFRHDVIDRFICAYENGCTPNPCIDCNRFLKFGKLFQRADELYCDYVSTGHYAIIGRDEQSGRYLLKKAVDPSKDQSYVLYSMTQEQLSRTLFPLGGMEKHRVREIAETHGFINAEKPDSQDICFVQNGTYVDFIYRTTGKDYPEGNFVDEDGNVLGRHKGVIRYTIGQHKGLGLVTPEPLYVKEIDPVANTVVLCRSEELFQRSFTANNINLIKYESVFDPIRVKAKVRYRQVEQWATAVQTDDDVMKIEFDEPQRAVTPGQAVVLYDGEDVIGGGVIMR